MQGASACCCRWLTWLFSLAGPNLSHSTTLLPTPATPNHALSAAPPQVGARTSKGQTPLHVAAEMAESRWLNRSYDYSLTMKLLIGAGAEVDALDVYGQTPLHTVRRGSGGRV